MEGYDTNNPLFNELNSIINREKARKVNFCIYEFVRKNAFIINTRGFNVHSSRLSNHLVGEYIISLLPAGKELKISLPSDWGINLKFDKSILFKIMSSEGNILNFENASRSDYFSVFNFLSYSAVIFISMEKFAFMLFDINTGDFKPENNLLLCFSEAESKIYINRKLYETKINMPKEEIKTSTKEVISSLVNVDAISIEMGRSIVPLIDEKQGGKLLERIASIRRHIAMEMGLIFPHIRFRDNVKLKPNSYLIKVRDVEVASGEVILNRYLAIGPEFKINSLKGPKCPDPTYSMPAVWINSDDKKEAEHMGCMIFDPVSVMATQITEVIRGYSADLLTRQEVDTLLDIVNQTHPAVIKEIYPQVFSLGEIQKVLQNLLKEKVSIKDMVAILETMADYSYITRDSDYLSEYVRQRLCRIICKDYQDNNGVINVITIDPYVEKLFLDSLVTTSGGTFLNLHTDIVVELIGVFEGEIKKSRCNGFQPVILCSPQIRLYVKRFTDRTFPNLPVLSYFEIPSQSNLNATGQISLPFYLKYPWVNYMKKILNELKMFVSDSFSKFRGINDTFETEKIDFSSFIQKSDENICMNCGWKNASDDVPCANCGDVLIKRPSSEDIDYVCLRLDVSREKVSNLYRYKLASDPRSLLIYMKKEILKSGHTANQDELAETEHNIGDKQKILDELISWLETEVSDKIKNIVMDTNVSSYEAFISLSQNFGDVGAAVEQLKGNGEDNNRIEHMIFEPATWQKIDYVIEHAFCSIGEAFKALIECGNDEVSAVQFIIENKRQKSE